jgi:hypothetical protein
MMLLIIVLFAILIGQVLGLRCERRISVMARNPQIVATSVSRDNVKVVNRSASVGVSVPAKKTTIVLPISAKTASMPAEKSASAAVVKVNGDLIIDGEKMGTRLHSNTKINGNLILQNMRKFTLPCGIKVNGNLIIRNVKVLNFCGGFVVNGDIYVSSDSSFGAIPRNAKIRGQIIF